MKKSIVTVLGVVLLWLASIGVGNSTDRAQVNTEVLSSLPPTVPGKVLSLDLCTDWMLARYARQSQVLALSPFIQQYPVDWVGSEWSVHDGSLDTILDLEPDLVITGQYNAIVLRQRLIQLGIRVEVMRLPQSLQDIVEYEQRLLSLLGLPLELASTPLQTGKPQTKPTPRLLLLGANAIGTGTNTFEHGVIQRAGWRNYLEQDGYHRLDLERIVADPPDAVMWSAPVSNALANDFAQHPVLQSSIAAEHWLATEYWYWQCPGPWTWQLIDQLQQLRHQFQ